MTLEPGAQILRYETQATTMNDRIDGTEHVGQRFEFALYPRRGGALEIPAPQVTLLDRAGEETGRIAGTPTRIEVTVPTGVDPSKPVVWRCPISPLPHRPVCGSMSIGRKPTIASSGATLRAGASIASPMYSSAAARSRSTPLASRGRISKLAGCGRRKGPAQPWPLPLWQHRRQPAIASRFGFM